MAENLQNSGNIQESGVVSENPAAEGEEYEYEYIEVADGEELPEDAEYEYVEVVDDTVLPEENSAVQESFSAVEKNEEPILSVPQEPQGMASSEDVVTQDKSDLVEEVQIATPLSSPVQEADLNALLDEDSEIKEVDAATMLDGEYSDDFAKNLFENKQEVKVEEVSLDDILGENAPIAPAEIENVREVSPEELVAGINREDDDALRNSIWGDLSDDEPMEVEKEVVAEEKVLYSESGEPQQITEETIIMSREDDSIVKQVSETVSEPVVETVVEEVAPVVEVAPEPVVETMVEEVAPMAEVAPEPVVETVVEEVAPVAEVAPEPVVETVVEEVAPVAEVAPEPVVESVVEEVAPVVEVAPEPVVETVIEEVAPVAEVAPEPIVETVIEEVAPVAEVAPEPVVETMVEEVAPMAEVALEPIVETVIEEVAPMAEVAPEPVMMSMLTEEPVAEVYASEIDKSQESSNELSGEQDPADLDAVSEPTAEAILGQVFQLGYQVVSLTEAQRQEMLTKEHVIDRASGMQFFELNGGSLLLNVDNAQELDDWHLIIFNQNLVPVSDNKRIEIVQPTDTIRMATVVKRGVEKLNIYNEEEYCFENPKDAFLPAQKHFIYGKTDDDTGLIVNDFVQISLRSNIGKILNFENTVFGWLSGPDKAQIYFAQLGKLAISSEEQIVEDEEKKKQQAAKWLSGDADDKYFEFSATSASGEFVGDDVVKSVHVVVGTSAYGWNVSFDNGVQMSLRDLQEYESKHGCMPSANGEISHGSTSLKFSNVEKIVAYQTPQYFAYGRS